MTRRHPRPVERARRPADDPVPVDGHPQLEPGMAGILLRSRPHTRPVRAAVGTDADQVESLPPCRVSGAGWCSSRTSAGPRLLVACLDGVAKRHARWRKPAKLEIAAAATELREVAGNRADLLAEVAGILLGASEGRLDEPGVRARPSCHRRRCRREHDPGVGSRRDAAGPSSGSIPLQPARSYTTAALNASGRCETRGSSGVAATVGHAQALALRWPSWCAIAAPHVRPGARANVNPAWKAVPLR